jgi:hypothetical protein
MKLANLMWQIAPDGSNGGWIQAGSVSRDALYGQLPCLQDSLKASEKGDHVLLGRIVVKHLEKQPLEGAIVHDG